MKDIESFSIVFYAGRWGMVVVPRAGHWEWIGTESWLEPDARKGPSGSNHRAFGGRARAWTLFR